MIQTRNHDSFKKIEFIIQEKKFFKSSKHAYIYLFRFELQVQNNTNYEVECGKQAGRVSHHYSTILNGSSNPTYGLDLGLTVLPCNQVSFAALCYFQCMLYAVRLSPPQAFVTMALIEFKTLK